MQQALRRLYFLYHELRPGGSAYSYVVSPAEFERQMDLFLEARDGTGLWPEVTFDDGHASDAEYALPVLQARGMTAHFFITVGWTGRKPGYMGWNELRVLHGAGQRVGAHGWTHTLLTHCDAKMLRHELGDARKALEDGLGAAVDTMSLPGGRYNRRVLEACRTAGYTKVFTSIPRAAEDSRAEMVGRLNVRGGVTEDWLRSLLEPGNRVLKGMERQYRLKAAMKSLVGDRLYEGVWARLNRQEAKTEDAAANEDSAHHQ